MLVIDNGDAIRGYASVASGIDFIINGYVGTAPTQLADGQLSDSESDLYASGADAITVLSIIFVNVDTNTRTCNLYLKPSGGTSRRIIPKDCSLTAGYSLHTDGVIVNVLDTAGQIVTSYGSHASSHENSGVDEINLAGLDGEPSTLVTHKDLVTGVHGAGANNLEHTGNKNTTSGYAGLDESADIFLAQIPDTLTGKDADTLDTKHYSDISAEIDSDVSALSGVLSAETDDKVLALSGTLSAEIDSDIGVHAGISDAHHTQTSVNAVVNAVTLSGAGVVTISEDGQIVTISGEAGLPGIHASQHENGGSDEISVAGLSGLLADDQHVLDVEVQAVKLDDFATPDDNTDLDATDSLHGLMSKVDKGKLDGVVSGADITGDNAPQAHKDSHDPQDGGDALDTANAAEITVVVAAGIGSSHSLARADHIHAISHAITDNHIVTIDGTTNVPVNGDYAKFTASGLEGMAKAQILSDLNVADGADVTGSNPPQAHKDLHDPADGSDPLDCAAAGEIVGVAAAAEGSAHSFARSDHTHQVQHSIADNHIVTVDQADAASGEYAKFTASGLESRSKTEQLSDLNVADGADVTGSNAPQAHAASHQNGGGDEISVSGLSGLLADDQHVLDTEVVSAVKADAGLPVATITFVIDGGGSAITTGVKGALEIPFACTINRVTLLADQSGSIVVDIWKQAYADYPPEDANSITASAPPTLSSAVMSQDSTLTGWTTAITAGDCLKFNVDSITTCTWVTLSLKVTKT